MNFMDDFGNTLSMFNIVKRVGKNYHKKKTFLNQSIV